MKRPSRVHAHAAAAVTLIILVFALALAACGGYCLPAPPTAIPTWPPGASPRPAITYPAQSATTQDFVAGSDGWFFEPEVDIEVTALGYYDDGQDGLLHAHRSAIFDGASKKVVVEATVQPQSPLDGPFRWEPVGPVVLKAGHEYAVVWETTGPFDPEVLNPEDASLALELRYLRYCETQEHGPTWGYPVRSVGNVILSGNLKFRPVSVASPSP